VTLSRARTALLVFSLAAGLLPAAAQTTPAKKADPEAVAALEKTLLTVPPPGDRGAWLEAWRKGVAVGFRPQQGGGVAALSLANNTPAALTIKGAGDLHKDGRKVKGSPPPEGWVVRPGEKLLLAAQPGGKVVAIKNDFAKAKTVSRW
jgi:hypothetical protein